MIKIIGVGAIKEDYIKMAIVRSLESIQKKHSVQVLTVEDEKCPENLSEKEKEEVKRKEGERILRHIQQEEHVIALTLEGRPFQEKNFRQLIRRTKVCFVIGGSLGLSDEVRKRANGEISFGPMTYPHQLMRWILLEQIDMGG